MTEFLTNHYATKPKTLLRYRKRLEIALRVSGRRGVAYPAQLTYKHAVDYVEWRQKPTTVGLYRASLLCWPFGLKIFNLLMSKRSGKAGHKQSVRAPWTQEGTDAGKARNHGRGNRDHTASPQDAARVDAD